MSSVEDFIIAGWAVHAAAADTCPGPLLARLRADLADLADLVEGGEIVAVPRVLALTARSRAAVEAWT